MSKKYKILIIDDEPLIRKVLSKVFNIKTNFNVLEAQDGIEGIKLWKEEDPDLVFLDILMPGLNGPQVLQEIGSKKNNSKVILISAYSNDHNNETAQKLGADLFIAKPFINIFNVIDQAKNLLLTSQTG